MQGVQHYYDDDNDNHDCDDNNNAQSISGLNVDFVINCSLQESPKRMHYIFHACELSTGQFFYIIKQRGKIKVNVHQKSEISINKTVFNQIAFIKWGKSEWHTWNGWNACNDCVTNIRIFTSQNAKLPLHRGNHRCSALVTLLLLIIPKMTDFGFFLLSTKEKTHQMTA